MVLSSISLVIVLTFLGASASAESDWIWRAGDYTLHWDVKADAAELIQDKTGERVFTGPLLPGLWLKLPDGERQFVKAEADAASLRAQSDHQLLRLAFPGVGRGTLQLAGRRWGLQFEELQIKWDGEPPAVIGLYFGVAALTQDEQSVVPSLELPFWARWNAEGYCVPSAKGAPVQSFFRSWDLGNANLPLGSFGPSLGTPYAAAFPRPVFSAALGGRSGWLALGPGTIPDAALSFEIRASTGDLHYLYREDLWGPPAGQTRVWREPLRMAWAATAWDAFNQLFQSFGATKPEPAMHQRANWNTWGNFKDKNYDLALEADEAATFGAQVLAIDEGWETSAGSGVVDAKRFPHFDADLDAIRRRGLAAGFWMPVGWITDPLAAGLTDDDLLLGEDKRPRRASWNMAVNSLADAHYCIDPSSRHARDFLRQRTVRIMRELRPDLLKLDFGYGLPGPDVSAPRDPELRGERLPYELIKVIVEAARSVNPNVTIQYYGIHPLMRAVTNLVALDDLGDAGGYEAAAHGEWSVWAALAGSEGYAIMSSSGYDWNADTEVLLDTAVIGAPGSVLPVPHSGESPLREEWIWHRQALARWYRRSTGWTPLWLNSDRGNIGHEPAPRCFGRIEGIRGKNQITALALRDAKPDARQAAALQGMTWQGRWALISQDDSNIFETKQLACVPFDRGFLNIPFKSRPARVAAVSATGEETIDTWTFVHGMVHLDNSATRKGLLGFLIYRK